MDIDIHTGDDHESVRRLIFCYTEGYSLTAYFFSAGYSGLAKHVNLIHVYISIYGIRVYKRSNPQKDITIYTWL